MIGSYPDAVQRPGTVRPGHPAVVELAGVQKTSRSGRIKFRALSGVDLAIAAAEMVAITGPPGSGKTTIMNLIAGIDRPAAGPLTVSGSRLDQMTEDQLAAWRGRAMGVVFQFFQLMPAFTAAENVTLSLDLGRIGPARQRKTVVSRNLATVGLGDRQPLELSSITLPEDFLPSIPLITLAGVLVLTLIFIGGPLCRGARIQPGTALRYQS
jgi:ABC-type transporter Mla maintaining outer membrane lipid asymmetry ATPase subunit MlaF